MAGRARKFCFEGAIEGELLLCVAPKCSTKASTHYGEQTVAFFFVSLARGSYFDSHFPSSLILLHKDNPLQPMLREVMAWGMTHSTPIILTSSAAQAVRAACPCRT